MKKRTFIAALLGGIGTLCGKKLKANEPLTLVNNYGHRSDGGKPKEWHVVIHYRGTSKCGGSYWGQNTILSGEGLFPVEVEQSILKHKQD